MRHGASRTPKPGSQTQKYPQGCKFTPPPAHTPLLPRLKSLSHLVLLPLLLLLQGGEKLSQGKLFNPFPRLLPPPPSTYFSSQSFIVSEFSLSLSSSVCPQFRFLG